MALIRKSKNRTIILIKTVERRKKYESINIIMGYRNISPKNLNLLRKEF